MECIVEEEGEDDLERKHNITFLYTLADGPCPKSFGVNVARLAGLPEDVLQKAKAVSSLFEERCSGGQHHKIIPSTAQAVSSHVSNLFEGNGDNYEEFMQIWKSLQSS